MTMIPSSISIDDEDMSSYNDNNELSIIKQSSSNYNKELEPYLLKRLGDILSHQKHYLNIDFENRRDWKILRSWKGYVGREQNHILKQLIKYPLFYDYINYLLGRDYTNFITYLQSNKLTTGEVDEIKRWQALQLTVISSKSVEDIENGNYIGYNVICEIKADETFLSDNPSQFRSRNWVACKRFREFRNLQQKLKVIHRDLAKLSFPSRTFMKSDTSDIIVTQRREQLNKYLQGVIQWIKKESPWIKGDTISREWIKVTQALEEFLGFSEMAILYPKKDMNPNFDKDFALHPSIRDDNWFLRLQNQEEIELYLSQTRVSLQALSYIFSNDNCTLSCIDLIGITSDPDEFIAFLNSIKGCETLKELYVSEISIGDISKATTCMSELLLDSNNRLEILTLTGWEMGMKFREFSSALLQNEYLRVLDISHCGINNVQTGFIELCAILKKTNILELYLDENTFGDDGGKLLSVALRYNPPLELLSLKYCKLTPIGIVDILNALNKLSNSNINSSDDLSIDDSPVYNSNLQKLYIADMNIEGNNYEIISDLAIQCSSMIENNHSLQELDLSGHYFNTENGIIIMRSLQHNTTLQKLNLSYSKRNWYSDQILFEFFQYNQSISSLHLRNHIPTSETLEDKSHIDHLTYSIPNDEILKELYVWNMRDDELSLLCTGFGSNTSLVLLDLQTIQLSQKSLEYLCILISSNTSIRELLLRILPELDISQLIKTMISSSITDLSLSNLTKEQGEIIINILSKQEIKFKRISISFLNGAVYCDIWEKLQTILNNNKENNDSSLQLF